MGIGEKLRTATTCGVGMLMVFSPVEAQECEIRGTAASAMAEQALNEGLEARSQQAAQSDFLTALSTVEEEMSNNPDDPPPAALWIAGRANLRLGHYAQGDSLLNRFANLKPACEQYTSQVRQQVWAEQFNAGIDDHRAGRSAEALEHFENANAVWSDVRSLENAAGLLEASGRRDLAQARYRKAIEVAETEERRTSIRDELDRLEEQRDVQRTDGAESLESEAEPPSEVVNGFHGYKWGTPLGEISEVAGTQPVSEMNGLDTFAAEVSLLGTEGTAWFMVDPSSRELLQGAYHFELTIANCERKWRRFERTLDEAFPALQKTETKDSMTSSERRVYDSYCEFYAYLADENDWMVQWANPSDGSVELRMGMVSMQLTPLLVITYQGDRAQDWQDQRTETERSILGPVPDDTTGGGTRPF